MFIAQAHSFTQQARLAITLAWIAGCTNTVSILACGHVISHVSGTTSDLGRYAADGKWPLVGFGLFLLASFMAGAVLSGISTEFGRRRHWESIFVLPIAIEMVILGCFALGVSQLEQEPPTGAALFILTGLASMSMGLQNATITRISSGVVRTTHVTGVLTDLGMELAQLGIWINAGRSRSGRARWWRGLWVHPTVRRIALLSSILGSFALGAGLGAVLHQYEPTHHWAMFPPVLFLAWSVFQDVRHPIAEIEPSTLVSDNNLGLPAELVVFHLRRDQDRQGKLHRMPDLLAWSSDLPESAKVIVLDISQVEQIEPDASFELRALLADLERKQKKLVIAGVTRSQFLQLRAAAPENVLDTDSVCPDLELAIARGLNLLSEPAGQ